MNDKYLIMETIDLLEKKEIEELDKYLKEYRQAHNIYMRLLAVRMVKLGETRTSVGEFIRKDRKTIGNWVKDYDKYGIEGVTFIGGEPTLQQNLNLLATMDYIHIKLIMDDMH